MNNYLTPHEINMLTEEVRKQGFLPMTDRKYIQDRFLRIVVQTGLKNEGMVRTMQQANEYLSKKYGDDAILFTEETYQQEIQKLNDALMEYKDIGAYEEKNWQRMVDIVDDLNRYYGSDIDISNYSATELNEIIKEAGRRASSDSKGSPSFYEHLMTLLENE